MLFDWTTHPGLLIIVKSIIFNQKFVKCQHYYKSFQILCLITRMQLWNNNHCINVIHKNLTILRWNNGWFLFWSSDLSLSKVEGFVDESLQIDTKRAFWDFYFSETNPQTKSLRIRLANLDLQVCKSRFVRICDTQCPGFVHL